MLSASLMRKYLKSLRTEISTEIESSWKVVMYISATTPSSW